MTAAQDLPATAGRTSNRAEGNTMTDHEPTIDELETEVRLSDAAIALIDRTDGAKSLNDVERVVGRPFPELLAEETGIDLGTVQEITSRPMRLR